MDLDKKNQELIKKIKKLRKGLIDLEVIVSGKKLINGKLEDTEYFGPIIVIPIAEHPDFGLVPYFDFCFFERTKVKKGHLFLQNYTPYFYGVLDQGDIKGRKIITQFKGLWSSKLFFFEKDKPIDTEGIFIIYKATPKAKGLIRNGQLGWRNDKGEYF
ncbi:hypothetical protein KY331_03315 [Candidatus Woesearchaeota archaeon]|nr:hypothetical protein [Candidatus Woesearchaeota archaeon]